MSRRIPIDERAFLKTPTHSVVVALLIFFTLSTGAANTDGAAQESAGAQTGASKSARAAWAAVPGGADKAVNPPAAATVLAAREAAPRELSPVELLASSRTLFVRSHSLWVRRKSIEDALMKKKSFLEMGYVIVKAEAEADLILEVDHTALTLRYPFTVTHQQSQIVVASGTVISLRLLNDVPGDTAGSFVKQAKAARAAFPNREKN